MLGIGVTRVEPGIVNENRICFFFILKFAFACVVFTEFQVAFERLCARGFMSH